MSRILFVMLHPGFIRYYEDALHALARAGHDVHVAFETSRDKLNESALAQRLAAASDRITCGTTPARVESVRTFLARGDRGATRAGSAGPAATAGERRQAAWESLATTVRLLSDYLRFFEPAFAAAHLLRDRAEKRLPRIYAAPVRTLARAGRPVRLVLAAALRAVEQLVPVHEEIAGFIRAQQPDLLVVTPLIELGSQQVDYVKAARALGVRSALAVASWDNLTSKGLIRVVPDHVLVWNEPQKQEAVELHGTPPERVLVTGAQVFDWWFDGEPSRSYEAFCRQVGLDPAAPFVLYVGSSIFIAPDEVPFVEEWIASLRASGDPLLAAAGVLLRPHPANSRQWRTLDAGRYRNVAIWPPIGADPTSPDFRRDYFDSLYHSRAVVGINTSAQLEAGIVGRPVFTIEAPRFAHAQAGTLHFHHLVAGAARLVRTARTLDEHARDLASVLQAGAAGAELNREFVRSFIRPHGETIAAVPRFVQAIEGIATQPPPAPQSDRWWIAAARWPALGLARVALVLAEDRPAWVYAARPCVAVSVRIWAIVFAVQARRRALARRWRDGVQALRKRRRRANKAVARAMKTAGSAARRVMHRA